MQKTPSSGCYISCKSLSFTMPTGNAIQLLNGNGNEDIRELDWQIMKRGCSHAILRFQKELSFNFQSPLLSSIQNIMSIQFLQIYYYVCDSRRSSRYIQQFINCNLAHQIISVQIMTKTYKIYLFYDLAREDIFGFVSQILRLNVVQLFHLVLGIISRITK